MCAGDKNVDRGRKTLESRPRRRRFPGLRRRQPDFHHKISELNNQDFYQIGLSANKTGISVYILGLEDKTFLSVTYAKDLGKASVTGYCIRFKTLTDINIDVLEAAIRYGFEGKKSA